MIPLVDCFILIIIGFYFAFIQPRMYQKRINEGVLSKNDIHKFKSMQPLGIGLIFIEFFLAAVHFMPQAN
jgi:hypothetical protein